MRDHHENAVRSAFYYDGNEQEGCDYYIVSLCDECTAERGGGVGEAGDLSPGESWHCEDCDSPNQAALELSPSSSSFTAAWRLGGGTGYGRS